jgi:hypothetical protein
MILTQRISAGIIRESHMASTVVMPKVISITTGFAKLEKKTARERTDVSFSWQNPAFPKNQGISC